MVDEEDGLFLFAETPPKYSGPGVVERDGATHFLNDAGETVMVSTPVKLNFGTVLQDMKKDAEDRRALSGVHAPPTGVCRVCTGKVVAVIGYPNDGLIGGPPLQGRIQSWHCENCFLMYSQCPPATST